MKRIVKIIVGCIGFGILIVTTCMVGMYIERNRQMSVKMQKEHISTIAVVNMDDGIEMREMQINYASQLMSFPGDNFTVTGLTDAKSGIEKGDYAAYIVIPETFSASVTSIENEPKKVILEYQYNANLDEESALQAINDVNAFINVLNSNIAYMYMDAILEEFHRVQDDSVTILSNDNKELELLENINAMQLIAVAEPVEEVAVEYTVKPVEVSAYTTKNTILLDALLLGYTEAVQKGKEGYAAIQEGSVEVETATDNFFSTYQATIEDSASNRMVLLDVGKGKLADAVIPYNQGADVVREDAEQFVEEIVCEQVSENQYEADCQLEELLQEVEQENEETLGDLQEAWETAYKDIKIDAEKDFQFQLGNTDDSVEKPLEDLIEDAYTQGFLDALIVLTNDINQWDGEEDITVDDIKSIMENYKKADLLQDVDKCGTQITVLESQLKSCLDSIHIDWENLNIILPTIEEIKNTQDENEEEKSRKIENDEATNIDESEDEYENPQISLTRISDEDIAETTNDILDLFKMQSDSEEINQIIQTYFVDALYVENRSQMDRLSDAEEQLNQRMNDYENNLRTYDPLQYIENARLHTYLNDIEKNARGMLDTVEENNSDYMFYATEMYTNTTEYAVRLRSTVGEANKETTTNVESCMNGLLASREAVNGQNISMLEGFTNSLGYTRVESQGNAEVYDYIVNPVISRLNGQVVTNPSTTTSEKENSVKVWLLIVLGMGIVICLIEIFMNLYRQYKKSMEEREALF